MRLLTLIPLLFLCFSSHADWETKCSSVKEIVAWPNGGDQYGLRFILQNNPDNCAGFWVPQDSNNKAAVQSIFLTALATSLPVCVQFDANRTKYNGACKLNYVKIKSN